MAARAALSVALRTTNVVLVLIGEEKYQPATAMNIALTLEAIGGQANAALAKRVRLCASAGLQEAEARKAAKVAERRVFPDGWDYAQRIPTPEFRQMPAEQQREYTQLHRKAVAAAAQAARDAAAVVTQY